MRTASKIQNEQKINKQKIKYETWHDSKLDDTRLEAFGNDFFPRVKKDDFEEQIVHASCDDAFRGIMCIVDNMKGSKETNEASGSTYLGESTLQSQATTNRLNLTSLPVHARFDGVRNKQVMTPTDKGTRY